jgi:DNA end-binding protein Ku
MAPRPVWKGYLKLSLVSCAVEVVGVMEHGDEVSFRTLNRKTGNPVRRQYVDSVTGDAVEDADQVKGYEVDEDRYVLVEDDEIDALRIESSQTLAIDRFVDKAKIEQVYLDTPYYLLPADKVSEEAFAVVREALAAKKMAGLASIVLYRRERPAVIEPLGRGLLMTTLRYDATVRRPEEVLDDIRDVKTDAEMVDLATHIIDRMTGAFEPDRFKDRYAEALLDLVKSKEAGAGPPHPAGPDKPGKVVDLFEALKRSLEGSGGKAPERKGEEKAAPEKRERTAAKAKPETKPAAKPQRRRKAG